MLARCRDVLVGSVVIVVVVLVADDVGVRFRVEIVAVGWKWCESCSCG